MVVIVIIWFTHNYNIISYYRYCINVLLYLIVNMCIYYV